MKSSRRRWLVVLCALIILPQSAVVSTAMAEDGNVASKASAGLSGQRIFSAGHSFHVFIPNILRDIATAAGVQGHNQLGVQSIGGSRVIQHWDLPEDRNKVKPALASGEVDVLTLSPIYLPDDGIEHLAALAVEKNPKVRVLIQEFWLPYDVYAPDYKQKRPDAVDRNARTVDQMRAEHAPYFKSMEDHVRALNKKLGKDVLYVVPVAQAVIALREKIIAGEAPGIQAQEELFRDAIGHATPPLQALAAYCYYASIYGRTPEGLPLPAVLKSGDAKYATDDLNRLLQQLAWHAVSQHPLSGVTHEGR